MDLLELGEQALRLTWPDAVLSDPETLGGSDRTEVVRARLTHGPVAGVVLKRQLGADGEARVREPAALTALDGVPGVARLLAVSPTDPVVVLADLGAHRNVADALLGDDPEAARTAVLSWAHAHGGLQRGADAQAFEDALRVHAGRLDAPVPVTDVMPRALASGADLLAEWLPRLGVTPSGEALQELRGVDELLGGDTDARALTPSDACPDNNVLTPDGLVLLDFEGAQVRHVAWDAAYLSVPWPSCWCSWRMPAEVAQDALSVWRQALQNPYADTAAFDRDLSLATAAWALMSSAWFLERALGDDHTHLQAPARRAMIQHRLAAAADLRHPSLPALAALAAEVLAATHAAWGDVPLALAPAWSG